MERSVFKFSCDQCHQKYTCEDNIPRLIPVCGHSICSNCLTNALAKNDSHIFICPFDQREYRMKERSLSMFPMNYEMINNLQTPKKGKVGLGKENCQDHQKSCELICLDDRVMICTDCALFGQHRGHNIQKVDINTNSTITRKRSIDYKEVIEEVLKESQTKIKEKLNELTELIDVRFNKFIVCALIEREYNLRNIENYISELIKVTREDSFTPSVQTQNIETLRDWRKTLQEGELEKHEAYKIFSKVIDSISISFDENLYQSLREFCIIDKTRPKLNQSIVPTLSTLSESTFRAETVIPKFKDTRSKVANLVEEISPIIQENIKYQDFTPPVKEKILRENILENFIYKYETEDHKFDKVKRTITNKTVYESPNLREIGIDLRLDQEDLIVLKSWNEDQNISEIIKRVLKENLTTINRSLAQYDVDLQIQEGIFKLVGTTIGSEPLSEESLAEIQNALLPMTSLENLSLNFMNCGKIRGAIFEDFCSFLGEFVEVQELELTFWGISQILPSSLTVLNDTFVSLVKLRVLKLSFGEWKGLNDEGIDKIRAIQYLSQLEHLELNLGRTSVTNKGLKIISEWICENQQITFLKLNMSSCLKINDVGFNELNQSLQRLKNLKGLNLNFDNCSEISDNSLISLCSILLKNAKKIETLSLYFYSCSKITDKTASTLCSFLPKISLLKELSLDFRWCNMNQEDYYPRFETAASTVVSKKILM